MSPAPPFCSMVAPNMALFVMLLAVAAAQAVDRFDVTATAPAEGWNGERTRQMVRTLLASRFGLAAHTETREMRILHTECRERRCARS